MINRNEIITLDRPRSIIPKNVSTVAVKETIKFMGLGLLGTAIVSIGLHVLLLNIYL